MIPGFLITWATFPGVIVHEFAHLLFCRIYGLKVYEVKYFQLSVGFGTPAGYVIHEAAANPWHNIWVSVGPFTVNTILGVIIALPAAIPFSHHGSVDLLHWFQLWLGVSIAAHAFPSLGDAESIWKIVTSKETPWLTRVLAFPIVLV
ncbi:MAG: DUF3267 domain-containing protein, partial [Fimbriimonas sp.]